MSVIENALSRSRQQRPAAEDAGARPAPAQTGAAAPSALQFQKIALDAAILERNCVLPQVTDRSALRSYKILRTRLLQRLAARKWRSVAVTSTRAGEGKTLTTINLALALSQDPNTRVCLVDFDLQRPAVANQLGMQFEHGLGEYLLGQAEAEQVIYDCGLPSLLVIPNRRIFVHSSEMLASARVQQLLRLIEEQIPDHILVCDMPPLSADDVLTFAPRVDGVLLVVAEGRTERASLAKAKELLADMNVVGVVLNRSAERDDGLSYY